ncbi:MAG: hypothetical protein R3B96_24195 [Pirellulaceae bacterium]
MAPGIFYYVWFFFPGGVGVGQVEAASSRVDERRNRIASRSFKTRGISMLLSGGSPRMGKPRNKPSVMASKSGFAVTGEPLDASTR